MNVNVTLIMVFFFNTQHGDTALILAAKRNRTEILRLLIDAKAKSDLIGTVRWFQIN